MIGFLSGTVAAVTRDGCFLDVVGVGYRLTCSSATLSGLPPVGSRCRLWTYLHVREDALALYGFVTEREQAMFESLLAVSGIGPRVALGLCSAFTPESFRRALVGDDVAAIASVSGIGKKTAQRVLVELKDRYSTPELEVVGDRRDALTTARSALENLGYSPAEVQAALGEVPDSPDDPVEQVIKSALRLLA